jgi:CheY-like chemotaxis protein
MEPKDVAARRHVLVIDDEPDISSYIASILEGSQYSVETANSAMEGERVIRDRRPDLILLDLMMPGRTGIQFFVRLKGNEETKDIPLIMVTGIKDKLNIDWQEIVSKLKARVPDGFVEKPIEPVHLMNVVEDVLTQTGQPEQRA